MKKHIFTLFAALCLCLSLLPTTAFAEEGTPISSTTSATTLCVAQGSKFTLSGDAQIGKGTVKTGNIRGLYLAGELNPDGGTNYENVGSEEDPNKINVTIEPKPVEPTVTVADGSVYDGTAKTPAVTVKVGDTTLTTADYDVSYENNVNAGTNTAKAIVTAKANRNYTWEPVTENFSIGKGAAPKLTASTAYILYTQTPYQVDLNKVISGMPDDAGNVRYRLETDDVASISGNTLTLNDIPYAKDSTIGAPVIVSSDNYADATVTVMIQLTDKEKKTLSVTMEGWTYGDTPTDPVYTKPSDATDLKIVYRLVDDEGQVASTTPIFHPNKPTEAGTYQVDVEYKTATEVWSGAAQFKISPKNIKDVTIRLDTDTFTYNGNDQKPTVLSVKDGDTTLVERTGTQTVQPDYKVSVEAQKNAGDYTITVTGEGNFTGTATTKWTIEQKPITANVSVAEKEYDGTNTATVTVSFDLNDSNQPVAGDSIEVTGVTGTFDNKNVGTNKTVTFDSSNATITGKGSENYKVTFPSGYNRGVITAKPVTATVTVADKVYDGTKDATVTAKVENGLIPGDEVIISGLTGTFSTADVGNGKTVYIDNRESAIVSGTGSQNYDFGELPPMVSGNIIPATPTGAPKYTAINTGGKTLADAALTVNDSWPAGTVKWVDANGSPLANTTTVAANTAYKWTFTPDSTNYNAISGTITLWNYTPSTSSDSSSDNTTITVPVSSDRATVEVKAEVSKGNATVEVSDKQIEKVAGDGAGTVTVDVSGLKNVDSATIPSHVVEKTNEAEDTGLTVALPAGSVALDETALESVTDNANGKDVTVSVETVSVSKLPTAVKNAIGMDNSVVAVVDVNVTVGKTKQSSFDGGKITISIPYTPKKGEDTSKLTVWFVRDDGTIENKGGWYDAKNKCFVFETDHLSQYLLVNTGEAKTFTDVPADAYFAGAVTWAAGKGITGGTTDTTFSPYNSCTRAQIVTFLYRWAVANGVDVSVGEDTNILSYNDAFSIPEYAIPAFQWAVGAGIVQGNDGYLNPNQTCTRAQAVTFLFRFAAANGMDFVTLQELVSGYSDAAQVPGYALSAFNWALAGGIVTGNNGALMPNGICTRAQIVTFLYRLLGN